MAAATKQKAGAKKKKKAPAKTEHPEHYKKDGISTEAVMLQIETTKGNLAQIARNLGVARNTIYLRISNSPELQLALVDARESMVDNAESRLYVNVMNGDTTALIFFLKTQGKRRGYTERIDVNLIGEIERELERLGLLHASGDSEKASGNTDSGGFVN